jgi:hypothetical protein
VTSSAAVTLHARLDRRTGLLVLCNHREVWGNLCDEEIGRAGPQQPGGTSEPALATRILRLPYGMAPNADGVWAWTKRALSDERHGLAAGYRQEKTISGLYVSGWVIGPERLPLVVACRRGHKQWLTVEDLRLSAAVAYRDLRVGQRIQREYEVIEVTADGRTVAHAVATLTPPQRRKPIAR